MLLFGTFITTDFLRAKEGKEPIFAIYMKSYEDGGSKKYLGLFYNVYHFHYINPEMTAEWCNEDGTFKDEYKDQVYLEYTKVTLWFTSIDDVKDNHNNSD